MVNDRKNKRRETIASATAVENERLRIARGLHDLLGPLFDEVAAALEDPSDPTRLERGVAALQEARQATRSMTFDLGLPPIDDHGLGGVLETICRSTRAKHPIEVVYGESGERQVIEDGVALVLSQIVRELLINVVKHADASCSAVMLDYTPHSIRITVQDDGHGLDVNKVNPGGFGLADARRRIDALGGHFEFGSKDGVGTRVVVEFPLTH